MMALDPKEAALEAGVKEKEIEEAIKPNRTKKLNKTIRRMGSERKQRQHLTKAAWKFFSVELLSSIVPFLVKSSQ